MSHRCVRCGAVYEDYDASILRGCKCGSIFFLYVKTPQDAEQIKEMQTELEKKDTTLEKEIEKQIEEKVEQEKKLEKKEVEEVKFGIETVRIPKEGIYEINLEALMKKRPLVILERGKVYFIHLPSVFEKVKKRKLD